MNAAVGELRPVKLPAFAAGAVAEQAGVRARLEGVADQHAQAPLRDFLASVHETALASGVAEVIVDVTALEFMGASCLAELVRWIEAVQNVPGTYGIRFLSNPQHRWQSRSLAALTCLASETVTVE